MRDAINQKSRPDEGRFESGRDWRSKDEIIGALGADVIIGWSPALQRMRRRLGHWEPVACRERCFLRYNGKNYRGTGYCGAVACRERGFLGCGARRDKIKIEARRLLRERVRLDQEMRLMVRWEPM